MNVVSSTNNITLTKYGLNNYKIIQHDDSLEIQLPWIETGYAWTTLAPDYYDISKKKKKNGLKTI